MGQNIGTCATAILSSIGVERNAKLVAAIHLSFNLIGTAFFMLLYFVVHAVADLPFVDEDVYDPHAYLRNVRTMDNHQFKRQFTAYRDRYLAMAEVADAETADGKTAPDPA